MNTIKFLYTVLRHNGIKIKWKCAISQEDVLFCCWFFLDPVMTRIMGHHGQDTGTDLTRFTFTRTYSSWNFFAPFTKVSLTLGKSLIMLSSRSSSISSMYASRPVPKFVGQVQQWLSILPNECVLKGHIVRLWENGQKYLCQATSICQRSYIKFFLIYLLQKWWLGQTIMCYAGWIQCLIAI